MDRTATFYSQPTYQRGSGLPVYSGSRRQRGGSVLGALKSFIMPFFGGIKNKALQRAKSEAFGLAKDVALDTFRGRNIGQSVKNRGLQRIKRLGKGVAADVAGTITGSTPRKRAAPKQAKRPAAKKRRQNF